jgi:hypothetical protein
LWIDVYSTPLRSFILVYVRETAGSFYGGYYFIFSLYALVFSCCFAAVYFRSSYASGICYFSVVLLGAWRATEFSCISFCRHSLMRRFGGYHLGCASESWSDLSRVIGRDRFWSVCLVSFRDGMCYSIVCWYRFCHALCSAGTEYHSGYVVFVFGKHLVLPVVHFSLFAIECVRHEVCHGG